jgi:hypothetical protein
LNTLQITKQISLDTGLLNACSRLYAKGIAMLADWRQHAEQRDLESYLGASQNMADLDRRLREVQYTDRQTLV